MASARAATAAAVAGLVAVAAWSFPGPTGTGHVVAGEGQAPTTAALAWQSGATGADNLPSSSLLAASSIEVAVVDSGADVTAPVLAGRIADTYDVATHSHDVTDVNGHGTFVASLAAGPNGDAARLLIVKAVDAGGDITAAHEAAAIRFAVNAGARIVNLSIAGSSTSPVERAAIRYAVAHGVLLVAAAGNDRAHGNPVEYPAALLQPVGSAGRAGVGLVVAASTRQGTSAGFSASGSWISLAAPGDEVFGSISRNAPPAAYPRLPVIGAPGPVGMASGTSFAAPQVAAAAALVWGVAPTLTAAQVAAILEETASGHGSWTPDLGYGVIDVAAAVDRATLPSQ